MFAIETLLVDLIHQGGTAILADLHRSGSGGYQCVGFWYSRTIKTAGDERHIDHTVAHRLRLFKHADGFRTAAYGDLDDAFAALINIINQGEKSLGINQKRRKRMDCGKLLLRLGLTGETE